MSQLYTILESDKCYEKIKSSMENWEKYIRRG
jgi:hypothetical protein